MKLSIITKTFRVHDNPFLDSDIYIIYIDPKEYGIHQKSFLNNILNLHIKDLKKYNIEPIILDNLSIIKNYIIKNNTSINTYVDNVNPIIKYPFKTTYIPSWCLIDWTEKQDMIKKWFLPEALKNHKQFKEYVHKNIRQIFNTEKKTTIKNNFRSNYKIVLTDTSVSLPSSDLDDWIINKLKMTTFMANSTWYKPTTSPSTNIRDNLDYLPNKYKTSRLSPFISLGVLSPLLAYQFWTDENRMGSSRDQLLFREMYHACAQMKEFWKDNFGKEYNWKRKTKKKWDNLINGDTSYDDLNFSIKLLINDGWIHHLARHLIADYLTRGKLEFHWKHGIKLFQEYLVDHDKCVNRGNWMWLSGTAFSSKQRSFYHYNYHNYIKNMDIKLKIKNT